MTETPFRLAKQAHAPRDGDLGVRALSRGLRVLEILAAAPSGLPLASIAERARLSKSSAYRLVQTLLGAGYLLQKRENGHYFPSLKILNLSHRLIEDTDLRVISRPHLELLAQATGETSHLVLLDNDAIVYVDKVEGESPVRMFSRIGSRAPAHCTGVGKAVLAFLPPERLDQLLGEAPLKRYTQTTITDPRKLRRHLAEIRTRGYSVDDGEHEAQVRCLAAPLFASNGEVVGACSVAAVSYRVELATLLSWWPLLQERSKLLSEELAHYFDRYT